MVPESELQLKLIEVGAKGDPVKVYLRIVS